MLLLSWRKPVIHPCHIPDARVCAADCTLWIWAQLKGPETCAQRIIVEQLPCEWFTDTRKDLDSLRCLKGSYNAGKHAQHTAFSSVRDRTLAWRVRKQAPVAGSTHMGGKNSNLSFKAKNRAMHVRDPEEHRDIIT